MLMLVDSLPRNLVAKVFYKFSTIEKCAKSSKIDDD